MAGWRSGGFTLVEIAAVLGIGIAGVLAALAVPAYKENALRERVDELATAAAGCKSAVASFYATNGRLPASAKEAGCPEEITASAYPLAVYEGEILVQAVGPLAAQLGPKNLFAFRALCAGGECAGAPLQGWTCSAAAKVAASTTILPKYLPSSCR